MDIYFGRIQALSQSEKLESRVRFALQVWSQTCCTVVTPASVLLITEAVVRGRYCRICGRCGTMGGGSAARRRAPRRSQRCTRRPPSSCARCASHLKRSATCSIATWRSVCSTCRGLHAKWPDTNGSRLRTLLCCALCATVQFRHRRLNTVAQQEACLSPSALCGPCSKRRALRGRGAGGACRWTAAAAGGGTCPTMAARRAARSARECPGSCPLCDIQAASGAARPLSLQSRASGCSGAARYDLQRVPDGVLQPLHAPPISIVNTRPFAAGQAHGGWPHADGGPRGRSNPGHGAHSQPGTYPPLCSG